MTGVFVVLGLTVGPLVTIAADGPSVIEFEVRQIVVEGPNPLSRAETDKLLQPYLGMHADLSRVEAARDALADTLREKGFAFYRVYLPEQKVNAGSIRLAIEPYRVDRVEVINNQYFTVDNILLGLPQLLGESGSPNVRKLSRNLALTNLNPAKNVHVTFSASEAEGKVDSKVTVQDENPRQFFVWLNNTGRDDINGETRLGAGFRHANLFDRDHVVTFSYTTAPEAVDRVRQYGAQYLLPLYRVSGRLDVFFAKSDIDSGIVGDFFEVSGSGDVGGIYYTQSLISRGHYEHRWVLGIADKLFDNDVLFKGQQLGADVRSRPLQLRYFGNWTRAGKMVAYHLEWANNIDSGSNNDDLHYKLSRAGATPSWSSLKAHARAGYNIAKSKWQLQARLAGQISSDALIPGEQFGLGGNSTVRGFHEREISGDEGYAVSIEIWSPYIAEKNLRLLGFFDAGEVSLNNSQPGDIDRQSLSSLGAGVRWVWNSKVEVNADLAHVIGGLPDDLSAATHDGDNKLHLTIVGRFR